MALKKTLNKTVYQKNAVFMLLTIFVTLSLKHKKNLLDFVHTSILCIVQHTFVYMVQLVHVASFRGDTYGQYALFIEVFVGACT